jgi:nucleoside-diphosphate kinase
MTVAGERTFIALKPDAVQRGLIGEIIHRFERKGLKLVGLKLLRVTPEMASVHYAEHVGKSFFPGLVDFITSGPVVAMVWQGPEAVAVCRKLLGPTKPGEGAPGTIRFDFGLMMERNIVHGSDGHDSAEREISIFFEPHEVLDDWFRSDDPWLVKPVD